MAVASGGTLAVPRYQRGDIVTVPFPMSAATRTEPEKRRPAVVLAVVPLTTTPPAFDYLLCQVTSQPFADPLLIEVDPTDVQGGVLVATKSYLRPAYLFTAAEGLILRKIASLAPHVVESAIQKLVTLVQPSGPSSP